MQVAKCAAHCLSQKEGDSAEAGESGGRLAVLWPAVKKAGCPTCQCCVRNELPRSGRLPRNERLHIISGHRLAAPHGPVVQLAYLVDTPTNSDDPKRHFKYPFAACEIFCCEVEGIFNTLLENEDLLDQLFSIVQVQVHTAWSSSAAQSAGPRLRQQAALLCCCSSVLLGVLQPQ